VPDVEGLSQGAAVAELRGKKLVPQVEAAPAEMGSSGFVLEQRPGGGATVFEETEVTIVVPDEPVEFPEEGGG
jgi:beta-lactam-binding protein with PASTA domain